MVVFFYDSRSQEYSSSLPHLLTYTDISTFSFALTAFQKFLVIFHMIEKKIEMEREGEANTTYRVTSVTWTWENEAAHSTPKS